MYKDEKLIARQELYRKCNESSILINFKLFSFLIGKFNLLEHRVKQNMSLRKKQLDNLITQKRLKNTNKSNYGIIPFTLKLDPDLKNINSEALVKYRN
jgi:hypothetical protein